MTTFPEVTIYTDGACSGNPGPGGWAALLKYKRHEKMLSGSASKTTNNRMELTAALEALRALKEPCKVAFYTDSKYLKKGVTEWMPGWKASGWRRGKKGKKKSLANEDLWRDLDEAIRPHDISWHWLRGHAGHPDNERVDKFARRAIPKG